MLVLVDWGGGGGEMGRLPDLSQLVILHNFSFNATLWVTVEVV